MLWRATLRRQWDLTLIDRIEMCIIMYLHNYFILPFQSATSTAENSTTLSIPVVSIRESGIVPLTSVKDCCETFLQVWEPLPGDQAL